MGRLWFCSFLLVHVVTICYLHAVRSEEAMIPLRILPAAVVAGIESRFPEAVALKAIKEHEKGKTWFEVTLRVGGKVFDVTMSPDGSIAEFEKKIDVEKLPRAVTEAIAGRFRNSKIRMAEEITRVRDQQENFAAYEVIVTKGGLDWEMTITPSGTIIEVWPMPNRSS